MCKCCERIAQAPAPSRLIARGIAGPGLLARVLVAKFVDHLPLYRQSEIYARQGVELDRATLADWVGGASRLIMPLTEALARYVLAAPAKAARRRHAGPSAAAGARTTKQGRFWVDVRDDRNGGSTDPPAVLFRYTPDRRGEHPKRHLQPFRGTLQADAYGGFAALYEPQPPGQPPPLGPKRSHRPRRRRRLPRPAATRSSAGRR